ncbi:MAG: Bax inhibitor-1/YccA family protein [Muribaculaceae bacterium]|nr:Bax inhibitor-1/YccA family protein [Muribaculaceae bacterium]
MENNYYSIPSQSATMVGSLMKSVYMWMTLALGITGVVALYVAQSSDLLYTIFSNSILFWGLVIAEFVLVMVISARLLKMSFSTALLLFMLYSVINGLTLSVIFALYTKASVASTFFVTAGTFGVMSLIGYFTKKDLSKLGGILFMLLIGLVIATLVNIFWANDTLYWITTYAGVLIFVGLTVYDTNKIKRMLECSYGEDEMTQKLALMGALTLYLDFINLFLYLLRILGDRK